MKFNPGQLLKGRGLIWTIVAVAAIGGGYYLFIDRTPQRAAATTFKKKTDAAPTAPTARRDVAANPKAKPLPATSDRCQPAPRGARPPHQAPPQSHASRPGPLHRRWQASALVQIDRPAPDDQRRADDDARSLHHAAGRRPGAGGPRRRCTRAL